MCAPTKQQTIKYTAPDGKVTTDHFGYDCLAEPRSDMLRRGDGTKRWGVENAACDLETYHGGLACCRHTFFLTDKAQAALLPSPPQIDTYFLKWRPVAVPRNT